MTCTTTRAPHLQYWRNTIARYLRQMLVRYFSVLKCGGYDDIGTTERQAEVLADVEV